jgi:anti-anti-sigma regulatory factor
MTIGTIILDCATLDEPDAWTIGQLTRLRLVARRNALDLRLVNTNKYLVDLIRLCGLAEVLRVESGREAE